MNLRRHLLVSRTRAFTLIELLVVMVIMSLLMLFAIPAFTQASRASSLSAGGKVLVDMLSLARQVAVTQNRRVEVRFYCLTDPSYPGPATYHALQLFVNWGPLAANRPRTSGTLPLSSAVSFPNPVMLSDSTTSSILSLTPNAHPSHALPHVGTAYQYVSFNFLPNGETDLDPAQNWVATLILENSPIFANGLPANYLTARIDASTGKVAVFRP